MQNKNTNRVMPKWAIFLSSKTVLIALLLILTLLVFGIWRKSRVENESQAEISSLEDEITNLERETLNLAQVIKYLRSDEYIEKEARAKLNYKMPGENVIIVSKNKLANDDILGASDNKPNWQLWMEYFFGNKI